MAALRRPFASRFSALCAHAAELPAGRSLYTVSDRDRRRVFELIRSSDGAGLDAVASLVSRMKGEPSRTWSVIVTFLGDAIVPRGGSVWLGTLLELFEALEVNAPVVRTAVSRLTADDWLGRERLGRNSFYRFSARGAAEFTKAADRVYATVESNDSNVLVFALLKPDGDKEASRAELERHGFSQLSGDLWMSAGQPSTFPADVIRFSGHAGVEDGRALARACWPLEDLERRYNAFLSAFSPLDAALADPRDVGRRDAIVARTLVVHEYRRVVLRDPYLPSALLPTAWPARRAAALCGRLYHKLLPSAEAWLDEHGRCEGGPLPTADKSLETRFHSLPRSTYNRNH